MAKNKYDETGREIKPKLKGYISATEKDKYAVKESFRGEIVDIPVRFPKELGAEHPFNFEDVEQTYKRVGTISGGINKITDAIVGDFSIKSREDKIKKELDDFIKQTDFATVLREWIREGFLKGNGFMELDLDDSQIRVLNANSMYVKRNTKGKVIGYNQWAGDLKKYSRKSSKLIPFKPNKIAHLRINKISGDAYGIGIVWPNERVIENMVLNAEALHKLIDRKAGAPIHAKVGAAGESVNPTDVDDFKEKLQFLTNSTEWVTDGNVDMKVIDFGEIGKNLTDTLNFDMQDLAFGMEIPIVLWGAGNIPEGLAKVQLESWQRKIASIREEIESMIEEKIFQPFLDSKKLKGSVEFVWNLPGEEEINKRIEKLTKLIENFNVSEPLRRMCELEVARLLGLEDAPKYLTKPEKETEEEKHPPAGAVPPKPGQPVPPKPKQPPTKAAREKAELELKKANSGEMTVREYVNITTVSKDYSAYLVNILRRLRIDKFKYLAAITELDIKQGLLSKGEIETLRGILNEGFRKNKTIAKVTTEIKDSIKLKDVTKKDKVITKSELRPNMIARTETVRFANLGLIDTYKKQDIKKVRWLAVISKRTCPICEALDGTVFNIDTVSPPPRHVDCRCTLLSEE